MKTRSAARARSGSSSQRSSRTAVPIAAARGMCRSPGPSQSTGSLYAPAGVVTELSQIPDQRYQ